MRSQAYRGMKAVRRRVVRVFVRRVVRWASLERWDGGSGGCGLKLGCLVRDALELSKMRRERKRVSFARDGEWAWRNVRR